MDKLTFDQVKNALPDAEKTTSLGPYKTYLKAAEPIGYKHESGILKYILDPVDACKKLKAGGAKYEHAGRFFKVVKWCAGKARAHIPDAKAVITDEVYKKLDMYNTEFVDEIYEKTDGKNTKVVKMDSQGLEAVDVTDVEDSDEFDESVEGEDADCGSSQLSGGGSVVDIEQVPKKKGKGVEELLNHANLKQMGLQVAELKKQNIALKERVLFHEKVLMKVVKAQCDPELVQMLFEGMCAQFD